MLTCLKIANLVLAAEAGRVLETSVLMSIGRAVHDMALWNCLYKSLQGEETMHIHLVCIRCK